MSKVLVPPSATTGADPVFVPKPKSPLPPEFVADLDAPLAPLLKVGLSEDDAKGVFRVLDTKFREGFPGSGMIDGSSAVISIVEAKVTSVSEGELTVTVLKGTAALPLGGGIKWEAKLKRIGMGSGGWSLVSAREL